jgi:hypothetical protein
MEEGEWRVWGRNAWGGISAAMDWERGCGVDAWGATNVVQPAVVCRCASSLAPISPVWFYP